MPTYLSEKQLSIKVIGVTGSIVTGYPSKYATRFTVASCAYVLYPSDAVYKHLTHPE
jgi:hypothetical protein